MKVALLASRRMMVGFNLGGIMPGIPAKMKKKHWPALRDAEKTGT